MEEKRKNYICNIRAPDQEWYQVWLDFKEATKNQGLDNCFVTLTLCKAWLKARKDTISVSQINNASQIILIYQTNAFNYNVEKPRRERFQLDCSQNQPKCTICSKAFQAYIIEKARELRQVILVQRFPRNKPRSIPQTNSGAQKKGESVTSEGSHEPPVFHSD